jgi:uridine kinase
MKFEDNKVIIIGICGGTCSGKSTISQKIKEFYKDKGVIKINTDSYYKDHSKLSFNKRAVINFDHPKSIDFELLQSHLQALKNGEHVNQPVYSFKTHNRTGETTITEPKKVVIVEGILILSDTELRSLFDIKIFVHADSDERLMRRLKRDIAERGRDLDEVLERYQTTLKPMHQQFIEPMKAFADIIIPNNHYNTVAVDVMKSIINEQL